MDGLTEVMTRINQIQTQFTGSTTGGTDFAQLLQASMGNVTAAGQAGAVTAAGAALAPALAGGASSGDAVVADAQKYLGVPYVWGGTDPSTGLDCSGLVQRVYADLGVSLPRVAADQARLGVAVPSLADARPGDLVTFGQPAEHIGIYVGDGKMIDAPHRGAVVRIEDVGSPTSIRRIASLTGSAPATAGSGQYQQLFADAAAKYGIPQGLLTAVAQTESNFDPSAVSSAGAQGMMQLMPSTAASLGVNPFDPAQAIDGAARILSSNLQEFGGSVPLAVAAYNAGSGAVQRYGGIPPYAETQAYVQKVLTAAGMGS